MVADNLMSFRTFEILYPVLGNVLKMDTCSRSGVPKSQPRWAAHTRIGIFFFLGGGGGSKYLATFKFKFARAPCQVQLEFGIVLALIFTV